MGKRGLAAPIFATAALRYLWRSGVSFTRSACRSARHTLCSRERGSFRLQSRAATNGVAKGVVMSLANRSTSVGLVVRVAAAVFWTVLTVGGAADAVAGLGDCSQPVTNGVAPTATDCLFVLQAAVGAQT